MKIIFQTHLRWLNINENHRSDKNQGNLQYMYTTYVCTIYILLKRLSPSYKGKMHANFCSLINIHLKLDSKVTHEHRKNRFGDY